MAWVQHSYAPDDRVPAGIVGCDTASVATGTPGCPKLHFSLEFIEMLVDAGYFLSEVAKALLVSRTTLWR